MNTKMDVLVSAMWAVVSSLLTITVTYFSGLTYSWSFNKQLLFLLITFLCNFLEMAILLIIGKHMRA